MVNIDLASKKIKKEMPSSYKLIKRRCKFSNPINHPTVMLKKKDLIKYNYKNPIKLKGSAIFLHLTKNYLPTEGCVALCEKDFLILAKLINKKTKIKIN